MFEWYLQTSIADRLVFLLIVSSFSVTMYLCYRFLTHSHFGWYPGVQSTPVFQLLMWAGALPLIIPAFMIAARRKKEVGDARYVGNLRSRVFHFTWCEYQQKISSIVFRYPLRSVEDAGKRGFRPCQVCRPY